MQSITITINSCDLNFQEYVNSLIYVKSGETVEVKTLDNITKVLTKD